MGAKNRKEKCVIMKILKATYGGKDCTQQIQNRVKNNELFVRVDNNIIGDPSIGQVKYLSVEWEFEGKKDKGEWRESTFCNIKHQTYNKLGIFYSNNVKPETQNTIKESLKTIEKASEGKADIMTCMWRHQEQNPFPQYIAWTQTFSHLNQLLQIMQLLYTARERNQYEYVSFLEHDVLYGEGYFDYPDFGDGEILCNMNYGGIKHDGFQERRQHDQPFHQMTMRFDDCIKHCETILPNALITNAGLIEPQTMKRTNWKSPNQSLHVNHGHHFTSHYSIYSNDVVKLNKYWGHIDQYKHLFHG